jgi:hypothetical protein
LVKSLQGIDVCGIASKAYIKSLSPINLIVAFNRTGIHPFNPEAIDETILLALVTYATRYIIVII